VYKSGIEDGAAVENSNIEEVRARFKPMDGFGGNPLEKESWWMMTEGMALRAARYNIFNEVEGFAKENGLYNFALNLVGGTGVEKLKGTNYAARKAAKAKPLPKEVYAAKILEEHGHRVFFTPENKSKQGLKNYDAIINGRLGEFKKPEKFKNIRGLLNKAEDQRASTVVMEPPKENHTLDDAIEEVRDWFKTCQKPIKYVDTVLLIWDGTVIPVIK